MRSQRTKRRDIGNLSIPLPPYPDSPASLAAATTFYNAARQEINDRVKFRDQAIIAIIGATFGLLGVLNPLDSKGAFAASGSASLGSAGLALLVAIASTALVINFACRYCGYQNAKIAELGYFITLQPALHLQAYGLHELLSEPLADGPVSTRPEVSRIDAAHRTLRDSFSHWDGWAAATTADSIDVWPAPDGIPEFKKEFSQDGVYRMLLTQFSLLPLAILAIACFKIADKITASFPQTPQALWFAASIGIALWMPVRVNRMMGRAQDLKNYYSKKRREVDASAMFGRT